MEVTRPRGVISMAFPHPRPAAGTTPGNGRPAQPPPPGKTGVGAAFRTVFRRNPRERPESAHARGSSDTRRTLGRRAIALAVGGPAATISEEPAPTSPVARGLRRSSLCVCVHSHSWPPRRGRLGQRRDEARHRRPEIGWAARVRPNGVLFIGDPQAAPCAIDTQDGSHAATAR